ncbi:unnamed protein product [Closterium sp. NIES-53]
MDDSLERCCLPYEPPVIFLATNFQAASLPVSVPSLNLLACQLHTSVWLPSTTRLNARHHTQILLAFSCSLLRLPLLASPPRVPQFRYLYNNQLSGSIPAEIGSMSRLSIL